MFDNLSYIYSLLNRSMGLGGGDHFKYMLKIGGQIGGQVTAIYKRTPISVPKIHL